MQLVIVTMSGLRRKFLMAISPLLGLTHNLVEVLHSSQVRQHIVNYHKSIAFLQPEVNSTEVFERQKRLIRLWRLLLQVQKFLS